MVLKGCLIDNTDSLSAWHPATKLKIDYSTMALQFVTQSGSTPTDKDNFRDR